MEIRTESGIKTGPPAPAPHPPRGIFLGDEPGALPEDKVALTEASSNERPLHLQEAAPDKLQSPGAQAKEKARSSKEPGFDNAPKSEVLSPRSGPPVTLTIIHTSDTHLRRDTSNRRSFERAAHMAGKISELRSENPTSIYVDAGDSVFGYTPPKALSEGRFHPVIDFYNLIKPDVLEIGNHELQFEGTRTASGKADNLAGFLREAGFPVICSNLVDAKTGEAPEGLKPYVMKEIPLPGGGVMKVGILGVVTQNLANRERHPLVGAGYDVTDPVEAMRKAIKAARTEGAEKIVLLHHDYTERAKHLAGEVDGIDVIIGAHDHRETMEPRLFDTPSGGKTLYVNSGSYSKYVGDLQLVIDSGTRRIIDFSHRLHPVDGATLPHGGILSLCREWERRYALVR